MTRRICKAIHDKSLYSSGPLIPIYVIAISNIKHTKSNIDISKIQLLGWYKQQHTNFPLAPKREKIAKNESIKMMLRINVSVMLFREATKISKGRTSIKYGIKTNKIIKK